MSGRLGEFEHLVLLALLRHGGNAAGTTIYEALERHIRHVPAVPALYVTLARLEAKGFVTSRLEPGRAARGGRRLKRFTISALGRRALRETRSSLESLWKGLNPEYRPSS